MPWKLCATSPVPDSILPPTKRRDHLPSWVGVRISETMSRVSVAIRLRQADNRAQHTLLGLTPAIVLSFLIPPHYVKSGLIRRWGWVSPPPRAFPWPPSSQMMLLFEPSSRQCFLYIISFSSYHITFKRWISWASTAFRNFQNNRDRLYLYHLQGLL